MAELQSDWDASIPFPWPKLFAQIHQTPFLAREVGSGNETVAIIESTSLPHGLFHVVARLHIIMTAYLALLMIFITASSKKNDIIVKNRLHHVPSFGLKFCAKYCFTDLAS